MLGQYSRIKGSAFAGLSDFQMKKRTFSDDYFSRSRGSIRCSKRNKKMNIEQVINPHTPPPISPKINHQNNDSKNQTNKINY